MAVEPIYRKEHGDYRMSKEDLLEANRRWKTLTEKERLRYAPTVATGAILGGAAGGFPALEIGSRLKNPIARKGVMASSIGLAGLGAWLGAGLARDEIKRYNVEEMMSPRTAQKVEKLAPGARLSRGSMSFGDLDSIDRARAVLSNPEGRGAWALLGQTILGKRKMSPDVTSKTHTGPLKKEAASRPTGGDPSDADAIKVLAGGGTAAAALPASARRLSSRVNLLHGTSEEAAEHILREGIRPPSRTGNHGITRAALGSGVADQPLVYVSKDTPHGRHQSRWYAQQAEYFDEARRRGMTDNQAILHRHTGVARSPRGKILRVALPYDELLSKTRSNPEMELANRIPDRRVREQIRTGLGSAVALEDGVDTRYIKGSKDYQRQTLKEIAAYARRNPGRFATGLGLGGVGLAGAALAAKGVHGLVSQGSSGNSDRVIERENALRKQASEGGLLYLGLHGWARNV